MAIVNTTNVTSKHLLTQMGYTYSSSTKYNAETLFISGYGVRWARFKPVKYSAEHHDHTDTDEDHPNWWKATNGYCGLNVPKYNNTKYLDGVADPDTLWTIDRPVLGTNPFRLGDFAGYVNSINKKDYVEPVGSFTVGSNGVYTSDVEYITQLFFTLNDNRDTKSLDITDFGSGTNALGNWYVGAILIKNSDDISSTTCRSYYSSKWKLTDLSDGEFDCYNNFRFGLPPQVFTHSNTPKYGIYTIYLALFQNANRYGSSNANITTSDGSYFVPLPIKPVTFTLNEETGSEKNLNITMNSLYTEGTSSTRTIKANVTITNDNSTSWPFKYDSTNASGCYFVRTRITRQYDDDYDSYANANTSTIVTVPAKSSSTFVVEFNYPYVAGYYTAYVEMCFRDGNGNITWTKSSHLTKTL